METDRIAVLDVETTGLSPWRHDRVVEIAIVVISPDGTVHREYDTLINPERDVGPTRVHQVTATDVLVAPRFRDIAGDVLEILKGATAIAGHNASFDKNFLVKEYERIGIALPEFPILCTYRQFGRSSLRACCDELDIVFEGTPHRAISDARAAARVVKALCAEDSFLLQNCRIDSTGWPSVEARKTPCFQRENAMELRTAPPRFLQRLAEKIRHDVEATAPSTLARKLARKEPIGGLRRPDPVEDPHFRLNCAPSISL